MTDLFKLLFTIIFVLSYVLSDGAGRTGTYCLIDMVLHRMSKGKISSRKIFINSQFANKC